ncbi:MAG: glycosyltransferase [Candidatus Levybacteria bacterium]|nr:glycosyltransferase [Candidatus Levybacteria bacterium]
MNHNKIAVIILTHNRFEEFGLALKSVLMQKHAPFHIFVFDNASKKPVSEYFPKNSKITYVRHRRNIGFAKNFRLATNYVKIRGFKYSFLLGDDDILAYSGVLRDLLTLIKKDKDVHVVRGGYVEFISKPPRFTRITIHDHKYLEQVQGLEEVDKGVILHITSYSGILYRNDYFNPYLCRDVDLITPFIAPLLKILIKKKFNFLPNKITVLVKTEHMQLATLVYNEHTSNQDALEKSYKIIGRKYTRHVSVAELINYKIYSGSTRNIHKYYQECLALNKGLESIPYKVVYCIPSSALEITKLLYKNFSHLLISRDLKINHKYFNTNLFDDE